VLESVKNYLVVANGVTSGTRERASAAARTLVTQSESTAGQVHALAGELVSQSKGNREAIIALVRYEVDRALGRVGLASSDEVAALRARVRTLEAHLRTAEARIAALTTPDGRPDGLDAKQAAKQATRTTSSGSAAAP
jgi:polyhydroxyalkanoate synthesis regulator phasin